MATAEEIQAERDAIASLREDIEAADIARRQKVIDEQSDRTLADLKAEHARLEQAVAEQAAAPAVSPPGAFDPQAAPEASGDPVRPVAPIAPAGTATAPVTQVTQDSQSVPVTDPQGAK